MRKSACIAAISIVLSLSVVSLAYAKTIGLPAPSGAIFGTNLPLLHGATVTGDITLTVMDGSDSVVNFWVTDPNNAEILRYDNTPGDSFSFKATVDGMHLLNFENPSSDQRSNILITVDYTIELSGSPITEEMIIIILAVIIMIQLFVVIWKVFPFKKPDSNDDG